MHALAELRKQREELKALLVDTARTDADENIHSFAARELSLVSLEIRGDSARETTRQESGRFSLTERQRSPIRLAKSSLVQSSPISLLNASDAEKIPNAQPMFEDAPKFKTQSEVRLLVQETRASAKDFMDSSESSAAPGKDQTQSSELARGLVDLPAPAKDLIASTRDLVTNLQDGLVSVRYPLETRKEQLESSRITKQTTQIFVEDSIQLEDSRLETSESVLPVARKLDTARTGDVSARTLPLQTTLMSSRIPNESVCIDDGGLVGLRPVSPQPFLSVSVDPYQVLDEYCEKRRVKKEIKRLDFAKVARKELGISERDEESDLGNTCSSNHVGWDEIPPLANTFKKFN